MYEFNGALTKTGDGHAKYDKLYLLKEKHMAGIDMNGNLLIGGRKIATGCTSMALHHEFLMFTTVTDELHFVSLQQDVS